MPSSKPLKTFSKAAVAAFPSEYCGFAEEAAKTLISFVDDSYRRSPIIVSISGRPVSIPSRIHFDGLDQTRLNAQGETWLAVQCLCTRSTDGYRRQAALRNILYSNGAAIVPFVVLLAGEYVVEIIDDILAARPSLDRVSYANFARENRPVMRHLRAKTTSYLGPLLSCTLSQSDRVSGLGLSP
jgi:hypothetical protein